MKQILVMMAAISLMGCRSEIPPPLDLEIKPKQLVVFTNHLGMKFVNVPETKVKFSIWETRVKDYAAYAAENEAVVGSWEKPSFEQDDMHPVVLVSWEDASAFCEWLTKKELAAGEIKAGQKYRLPTDAEWSFAVGLSQEQGSTPKEKSGGIKGMYPWGSWDDRLPQPLNSGNYGESVGKVDNFSHTSPAGSFTANSLGIHDLGGNVWEWCEDVLNSSSKARVLRGASWYNDIPDDLLSSIRYSEKPDRRDNAIGFRCVLASE